MRNVSRETFLEIYLMREQVMSELSKDSLLGKQVKYSATYQPQLLFPIEREIKRKEIGIVAKPTFFGWDSWDHYEVSWLNEKGKPIVAIANICYDCHSPKMIESKSMKLYFNSFNQMQYDTKETLALIIQKDIANVIQSNVMVTLTLLSDYQSTQFKGVFEGDCLDDLDIFCEDTIVNVSHLKTTGSVITETLYSDLLKSNCLVTNQPDWGSVQICYTGAKIDREGLLKYIVSFRTHNEFHEQCIERIYMDIIHQCQPDALTVYGRYTRRGGIDINPIRSSVEVPMSVFSYRLSRQ
jgi:7-cyano-7-deazaguanine reductase